VGLIISCFNSDAALNGRIQMIAFQSLPGNTKDNKGPEELNIPLHLIPAIVPSPNTLTKIVELQRILFEEGKATYHQALQGQFADPKRGVHLLNQVHGAGVYTKVLCRLLEYSASPLLTLLEERQKQNVERIRLLQQMKADLLRSQLPQ